MANSPVRGGRRGSIDVGSVIADTYTIEALLGRGGMGAVFLASHKRLAGKHVAIKILHSLQEGTEIEDAEVVARFKREAEIAAKLNHPNIVGVIDYNVAPDGMPYLVLDYLEGETLAERIARGPMVIDHVLSIVRQVGSALAAAHRAGIVHRDLKPQNVFLVPTEVDGREVEIAKVLDFGISKIRGSQTVKTQDSALLGTPQYMAPEQAMGQQDSVDERTDVFALGAIVYEMLSGQPAFPGASIPEVVFKVVYEQPAPLAPLAPSAPPGLVAAVLQAMAKRSEERFPTVTAFVEAITGKPLTAARAQAPAPTGSPSAFAQTMGSGDLGGSPERPMLATMPPAGADSASAASTSRVTRVPSASQLPGGSSAPASAAAPTVDLHAGPDARSPRPRRRSLGALAVIALAGAAVATGAVYVAMHRGAPSSHGPAQGAGPADNPDRHVAVVTSGPQASDRPAEPRPAEPRPAEPRPAEPRPARKPEVKPAPRAHGKPEPGPAAGEDQAMPGDDGDAAVREQLKEAAAALDRHDYDLAERLANTVVNSPAGPKQRAAARLIHGTIQCVARNDQEAAQIDLRNLERFRALRTRLLNVCRSHGVLSSP